MLYDLIIIGAGPAGLAAAIYAVRKKIKMLVLAQEFGGQAKEAHVINNYPGIPGVLGMDLVEKFKQQAEDLGVEMKEGIIVEQIKPGKKIFEITTNQGEFQGQTLIITTGKTYRKLDVPGAQEFEGKGITYCATCDAPLFKNKIVAVVGGGDAGQDAAWQLTKYATKVYLLNKYPELRGDNVQLREKLKNHDKVEIFNNYEPLEVKGDKFVKGLVFRHNGHGEIKEIAADGIFVEIGSVPSSEFLQDMIKLNKKGEIIIDPKTNMTSREGIFAGGDVTDVPYKQMVIAAGEGAKAALSAYEYLKTKNT